jgi:6-phosphogluconolactonase
MRVETEPDAWRVAKRGAAYLAEEARSAVSARGKFLFALSGGKTPWKMLQSLATESVPWAHVHVFQVDERAAPEGHAERNLTRMKEIFLSLTPLAENQIHGMPVELDDLDQGAKLYEETLRDCSGAPPVLDVIHLGLGGDGHTASLLPGDAALDGTDRDVAVTGPYFGRQRMTLTLPMINRARKILWLVTGVDKGPMLKRLQKADPAIPAGRIQQTNALLLTDTLIL